MGKVSFEHSELAEDFKKLRNLMYGVYSHVTQQDVGDTLGPIYEFLESLDVGNPFLLLALLTDDDVANISRERMKDIGAFNKTGLSEIVPYLQDIGTIDLCNPYLDW